MAYPKHAEEALERRSHLTQDERNKQLKEGLEEYLFSLLHGVLPWTESLTHERFEKLTPIPEKEWELLKEDLPPLAVPITPIRLPPYIRKVGTDAPPKR